MIVCRPATPGDLDVLARWNRQLQEDEGSAPMEPDAIVARLERWLSKAFRAVVFEVDSAPIGYALFRAADPNLEGADGVYLRQFFISRAHRRAGCGTEAFQALAGEFFEGRTVVLEALRSNPGAHEFWASLGFRPYSTTYHRVIEDGS